MRLRDYLNLGAAITALTALAYGIALYNVNHPVPPDPQEITIRTLSEMNARMEKKLFGS